MRNFNKIYALAAFIAIIIINGCTPGMISLKGNYSNSPVEITSNKSSDTLWLKITQLFAEKGLVIDRVDKKKGLIVSKKTSFIPVYTFENKDGQLNDLGAWVVLKKIIANKKEWNPKTIYSQWSIQMTETGTGTTTLKIDPVVICTYYTNMFTEVEVRAQSTGKLEELIKSS